ncbi:hypothetical protein [Ruegeria lacuscaerulensis]|uniref:hypothetical protein n=1 Tax=Ruegeria lacuscaerulensis TaxID=55218 RepID=UPI00147DCD3E|nr:hypothetical protein [Ruegeria lacuscaerulensis]
MNFYYWSIPFPFVLFACAVAILILLICAGVNVSSIHRRWKVAKWRWKRLDSLVRTGAIITLVFLLTVAFLSGLPTNKDTEEGVPKLEAFIKSKPNEIGDALAGVSSTLAFFWLILTVMLQGKQLSAQKRELTLTRLEFKKMSKAQEKQVEIMDVQKNIFEKEQKQREEVEAKEILESLKQRLFKQSESLQEAYLRWHLKEQEERRYLRIECWDDGIEERIGEFCASLAAAEQVLIPTETTREREFFERPNLPQEASFIENTLRKIKSVLPSLSVAERNRAQDLGLDRAVDDWSALARQKEIWSDSEA